MFRSNAYNEGKFYKAVPIFRKQVVPGESVEIDALTRWETPPFKKNVLSGGVASVYAFYCPHRLVWDKWVDFIADPESGEVLPTTTVDFPEAFEFSYGPNTRALSALFRRAYKLAFNQFFGSEDFGVWYNVNNDAVVDLLSVRTNDQWLGRLYQKGQAYDPQFNAPVTGTAPNQTADISLNDFRRAMQSAKQGRRAAITGDKYVDAMMRLGVKLDWRVQQAPEFLGAAHVEFEPSDTRASYSASDTPTGGAAFTGQAYSRYQSSVTLKTPRRFFSEHGYVFGVLVVRPFAFQNDFFSPADALVRTYDQFFLGENNAGVQDWAANNWCGGNENVVSHRFEYLLSGNNMSGRASPGAWLPSDASGSFNQAVYVQNFDVPQIDLLDGAQLASLTRCRMIGPTPVKRNIV